MNKAQLRQILIERRNVVANKAEKDTVICSLLSDCLKNYDRIFIYVSIKSEVCTHGVIDKLIQAGKRIYVPYTDAQKNMCMSLPEVPVNYSCVCGYGNVKNRGVDDGQAAVAVVPILGYNSGLYRIGYGAGCYDKFFGGHKDVYKIGLAYSEQQCEFTPDDTDVAMDIIITQNGILRRDK